VYAMSRKERLGLLPAVQLDDRFVLARVAEALVANLADIVELTRFRRGCWG
jgi:hypothetical protein